MGVSRRERIWVEMTEIPYLDVSPRYGQYSAGSPGSSTDGSQGPGILVLWQGHNRVARQEGSQMLLSRREQRNDSTDGSSLPWTPHSAKTTLSVFQAVPRNSPTAKDKVLLKNAAHDKIVLTKTPYGYS